ncbi:hypothetical protein LTR86_007505 [Recurvomyces mirabilis]|nr:hypothetical protein LTR86_007505 [Recurvomyces mirabilis]
MAAMGEFRNVSQLSQDDWRAWCRPTSGETTLGETPVGSLPSPRSDTTSAEPANLTCLGLINTRQAHSFASRLSFLRLTLVPTKRTLSITNQPVSITITITINKMHAFTVAALAFASLAVAAPHTHGHSHNHARAVAPASEPEKRDDSTFELMVHNNCAEDKTFGLYQINSAFQMSQMSETETVPAGTNSTISAPFSALGMRLSATADKGTAAQWEAQTLFEFGYSAYNGMTGTAYDLSVMQGSTEGIAAYPENTQCESKVCSSLGCALAEAWTDATQVADGSPADTVCYHGVTNFRVVWCPSS